MKLVAKNKNRDLCEQPLFEDIAILHEEADLKSPYKLLTISGTASRGGVLNQNRRLYPTTLLNRCVEKAQTLIQKGKMLGEVDHPSESGSLGKTAMKFTRLWMEGDLMLFEADVLATKAGEHLALLLHSGVGVGISTRGYGSVRSIDGADGTFYEVQPDFELKGIDCVLEASNVYGKVANFESKEGGNEMELTLEMLQTDFADLYNQVVADAKVKHEADMKEGLEKEFELKVASAIEEKKEAFMTEAKNQVMESEEIKQLRDIVSAVMEAVKPMVPEAKTKEDLDAEIVQANESLQAKVATLEESLRVIADEKAKADRVLEENATAQKVADKLTSLVEGHRFKAALLQKLAGCKTETELDEKFTVEVAFITALTENAAPPAGNGTVPPEAKTKLTESAARLRQLAGIVEGGK